MRRRAHLPRDLQQWCHSPRVAWQTRGEGCPPAHCREALRMGPRHARAGLARTASASAPPRDSSCHDLKELVGGARNYRCHSLGVDRPKTREARSRPNFGGYTVGRRPPRQSTGVGASAPPFSHLLCKNHEPHVQPEPPRLPQHQCRRLADTYRGAVAALTASIHPPGAHRQLHRRRPLRRQHSRHAPPSRFRTPPPSTPTHLATPPRARPPAGTGSDHGQ